MKSIFLKNSKKLLLTIAFLLVASPFFAQSAFEKFEGQDDVTALIVNRKMFELMSKVKVDATDKEAQRYMNLIKKLDNLRVFTTASAKATADLKLTADKYVKSTGLEELMRVNDSGKNIKILVKSGNSDSQIKELLMFIEGSSKTDQTVLMSLTGDFDLNEIAILTDKMKIPGGDELKKVSKNKK
jgi:hypothetical protein